MQRVKKIIRFFLGVPISILAFLFIIKLFFDNKNVVIHTLLTFDPLYFLCGIFFFTLFFAIKSFVWLEIIKKRGFSTPLRKTIFLYSLSEVKRYIPGSIFAFLGRMNALADSIPQKETLKGIGIEAVLLALSALVISIPAISYPIFKAREQGDIPYTIPIVIAILLFLVAITFIYSRFRNTVIAYFDSFLLFLLAWLFYALGCFFVAISIAYIYPTNLVFILSFFVLSWLAGYLLFVTPMGLGVRELVITGSLSLFIPTAIASVIAVLSRVGMVLGELFYLILSYTIYKIRDNSRLLKINPYFAIVMLTSIIYFLFFTSYTFVRHDTYFSGRFDLGNMTQTVWNTNHGNLFTLTNPDGVETISRFADHSDVILVLFAPFYFLWSDPKMLLIIQSLTLATGGIFVYLLSKKIIKNELLSLTLSISFLLNFWVAEENMFDFHSVTLATTFLLATFYFLLKKRYFLFSIFLILGVMTKENVFLVASVFGMYIFFKEKKRLAGALLTTIPILIFFYLTSVVIPHARGNAHFALSYYSYLGDSTQGIVKNLLLKPQIALSHVFSLSSLSYIHELLIPTGYLALMSPVYIIFALPDLLIYLLSANEGLRSYQYHYGAVILPFIYISTMYSVAFIIKKIKKTFTVKILFYYLLGSLLISTYLYSPLPGMREADYKPYTSTSAVKISQYLALIPPDSSVSASNNVGAHLSHRDKIYVVPNALQTADYVVLYGEKKSMVNSVNAQKYESMVTDELENFYLFKKKSFNPCLSCTP